MNVTDTVPSQQSNATTGHRPTPKTKLPRRRKLPLGHWGRIVGGVLISVLFLFPVFWMVSTSLKSPTDIFTTPPELFASLTFENYGSYMRAADIPRRMLNTVIVAIGSSLISIVLGVMAGYALARFNIKGGATIGVLILASRGVPPIALAVPMFLVARNLGITDMHITLILAYCTFIIPYVMWLMRAQFMSIPKEIEESAMLDGASRLVTFFRIIVPMSLPAIVSTLIFSVILAWEELLFALVLTNRNASTIPAAIAGMAADTESGANWGALTAVGTMTVIPVIIFALLVQKHLIKGIGEGAVKG